MACFELSSAGQTPPREDFRLGRPLYRVTTDGSLDPALPAFDCLVRSAGGLTHLPADQDVTTRRRRTPLPISSDSNSKHTFAFPRQDFAGSCRHRATALDHFGGTKPGKPAVHLNSFGRNENAVPASSPSVQCEWGRVVLGRYYFTRQAASLLRFARSTSNPELAALLVQKAADLRSQVEPQQRSSDDKSPQPPDVEWSGPRGPSH